MPPARAGHPRRLRILAVGGSDSQGRDRGHRDSLSACAAGWCAARLGPHARWAHGTGRLPACGRAGRVRQQTPGSASESAAAAAVVSDNRNHPGFHGPHGPVTDLLVSLTVTSVQLAAQIMIQVALQLYGPGRIIMTKKSQKSLKKEIIKSRMHYKVKKQCLEPSRSTSQDAFPMSADISEPKATIQSRPPE